MAPVYTEWEWPETNPGPPAAMKDSSDASTEEEKYYSLRTKTVEKYFEGVMGVDDYMARVEMALMRFGFSGDNSIAVLNLCRDEICNSLKRKVMNVFGDPFNIVGLGGVITCGVTGLGAGLSHAPKRPGVREKYVFFSYPHVSVSSTGELGVVSRAARPGSHACGAILKVLGEVKKCGVCAKQDETHDALDPEYSILKQRIDKHIVKTGVPPQALELHTMTMLAEEAITDDLEKLIGKAVDVSKADYAVITGIQVHSWATAYEDDEPNLEYIQPCSAYVVINGRKTALNLKAVSALTPRMLAKLCDGGFAGTSGVSSGLAGMSIEDSSLPKTKDRVRNDLSASAQYARQRQGLPANLSPLDALKTK